MIVNWNGMSYLTAIKRLPRYPVQLCGCHWCGMPVRPGRAGTEGCRRSRGLLASIALGYGVMLAWDVVLLYRYFPQSDRSPLAFCGGSISLCRWRSRAC